MNVAYKLLPARGEGNPSKMFRFKWFPLNRLSTTSFIAVFKGSGDVGLNSQAIFKSCKCFSIGFCRPMPSFEEIPDSVSLSCSAPNKHSSLELKTLISTFSINCLYLMNYKQCLIESHQRTNLVRGRNILSLLFFVRKCHPHFRCLISQPLSVTCYLQKHWFQFARYLL